MNNRRGPGYDAYAKRCVEACVSLMGEHTREFWETQCSWEEQFAAGTEPGEVAENQKDSL